MKPFLLGPGRVVDSAYTQTGQGGGLLSLEVRANKNTWESLWIYVPYPRSGNQQDFEIRLILFSAVAIIFKGPGRRSCTRHSSAATIGFWKKILKESKNDPAASGRANAPPRAPPTGEREFPVALLVRDIFREKAWQGPGRAVGVVRAKAAPPIFWRVRGKMPSPGKLNISIRTIGLEGALGRGLKHC